jgi:hypothetical protein
MATQLKNLTFAKALEIVESEERRAVTTPDAGVLLLAQKRNEERTKVMSEPTGGVVSVAKRSAAALEGGEIGQETFAKLQQRLAQEMFPNDSIGVALGKFFATPHGAEMLNRGLKKNYEDIQKRVAVGNAYDVLKSKDGLVPHARAAAPRDTSDDDNSDETIDQKVERLMRDCNISRDAAISIVHRAEKVAKGFSF